MLLQDLQPNFQLYAVCADCNRMESVNVVGLLELLPADTPMDSVRRRVRCRQCGQRTGDIRIVYVGHGEHTATFQYRPVSALNQSVSSSVDSSVNPKPPTPT